MIVVRRLFAFLLLPLLALLFFVALLAGRVDATILNPDYLLDRAEDADLYAVVHTEGIPALVDSYVDAQEERLPENLRHANLPTDDRARERMTQVLQTLLPPEFMQAVTEGVVTGVVPYMAGREAGFEFRLSLYEPLTATFSRDGAARSVFQDAWYDLDFSERLIRGFAEARIEEARSEDAGVPATGAVADIPADAPLEEMGLLDLLSQDIEGASDWWDGQFFGVVDGMLPYLVGDSDEFDVRIDFTVYPALAYAFEGPLQLDANTLQRQGWEFSSDELRRRMAESDALTEADIDNALAILRPEGATFDEQDLAARIEEQREQAAAEGRPDEGPQDLQAQRTALRNARLAATWGAGVVAALLVLGVAFLGGRGWSGRLRWGSAALLAASLVSLVLVTPVYAIAASDRVDRWFDARRDSGDGPLPAELRAPILDEARGIVSDFLGGMQARALAWFVLAAVGLALSFALERPEFRARVRGWFARVSGRGRPAPTAAPPAP